MCPPELKFPDIAKVFPATGLKTASVPLPPSATGKTRVLIADENPVYRLTLFQFLTEGGYEVVIAENGNEAITELRKPQHPPIAILDQALPGMSSQEICKRMRSVEKRIYLILCGDLRGTEETAAALEAGADGYLPRPIAREELLALVRLGLGVVSRQRALTERADAPGEGESARF
jgi:DNA-binding response OmpR family regulator